MVCVVIVAVQGFRAGWLSFTCHRGTSCWFSALRPGISCFGRDKRLPDEPLRFGFRRGHPAQDRAGQSISFYLRIYRSIVCFRVVDIAIFGALMRDFIPWPDRFMKILHVLLSICLAIAVCGCHLQSADVVPAGSFRLVVDDPVNDQSFRIASLKVLSLQPGTLSVGMEGGRDNGGWAYGQLLAPATDRLPEGRVLFIASRATDSRTTNAYILAQLQVMAHGTLEASCCRTYYPSSDTRLADFASMTVKDGIYPLDTPLEIGRIDGKPVTLTVGKQPR